MKTNQPEKCDRQGIARLVALGYGPIQIAKQIGCGKSAVYRTIARLNLPYSGKTKQQLQRQEELKPEILRLYATGMAITRIAKIVGCHQVVARAVIRKTGQDTSVNQQGWNDAKPRRINTQGYAVLYMKDCPYSRRKDGYIAEHIYKACCVLGRKLKKNEVVHHLNGDRSDNRNENLLICDRSYHTWLHQRMGHLYMELKFGRKPETQYPNNKRPDLYTRPGRPTNIEQDARVAIQ